MKRKTTMDRRRYKTTVCYNYRLKRQRAEFQEMYDDVKDYLAYRFLKVVL